MKRRQENGAAEDSRKRPHRDGDDDEEEEDKEHLPGGIVRVSLRNFVTYDHAEFFPGPNLNMILGPNGTGKSTLVCAICLGLGGKPSLLGRSKDLKDFVKHGTAEGERTMIEVELKGEDEDNVVIRREFTAAQSVSKWRLNGKTCTEANVRERIKELNVQVENLIQFLPQDRVAEFSKLSPPEVLVETEKATGGEEMHKEHQKLAELKRQQSSRDVDLAADSKRIEDLERKNQTREPEVQRFQDLQMQQHKLKLIEKKIPWLEYEQKRGQHFESRVMVGKKAEELEQLKKANEPLRQEIEALRRELAQVREEDRRAMAGVNKHKEQVAHKRQQIEKTEDDLDHANNEMQRSKESHKKKQEELEKLRKEIEAIEASIQDVPPADDSEIKRKLADVSAQMQQNQREAGELQAEGNRLRDRSNGMAKEMSRCRKRLEFLDNVTDQRLEGIRGFQKEVYTAVHWLRQNRGMFKGVIYEPIFLQDNAKDVRFANEIEAAIPFRYLYSFVSQNQEDHELLLHELGRQRLKVNAITVPSAALSSFYPAREKARELGFEGVVLDMIEAPDDIKRCLCQAAFIHRTPLGKKGINVQRVVDDGTFSAFFCDDQSHRVIKSRYGMGTSTTSSDVRVSRIFSATVDMTEKTKIQDELRGYQEEQDRNDKAIQKLDAIHKELRAKDEPLRKERDELLKEKNRIARLEAENEKRKVHLAQKQRQFTQRQNEIRNYNPEEEERAHLQAIDRLANKRAKLVIDAVNLQTQAAKESKKLVLHCARSASINARITLKERELADTNQAFKQAEKELKEAEAELSKLKREAKELLEIARRQGQPTDEEREEFKTLSNVLEELNAERTAQQNRIRLISNVDESVLKEYEKTKAEIEALKQALEKKREKMQNSIQELNDLENSWKPKVQELVNTISTTFRSFMNRLGCDGECRLDTGDDYLTWGIQIMVKFREAEELQKLSRQRQSGGERAVSTILYLMSLQEMAKSPFRVVDEINQGMDPKNERLVHNIIVETATKKGTSQYFLVTPKLLPNLTYNNKIKVMCIYSGDRQRDYIEWDVDKFIGRSKQ